MGKKRGGERDRNQNPMPFLAETSSTVSKNRFKSSKRHHHDEQMISKRMSNKILKEAFKQQKEIEDEENQERERERILSVPVAAEEEDIDDFDGFDETKTQFDAYEDEIDEKEEQFLDAFLSKDVGHQKTLTLGDVIAARIKAQHATVSAGGRSLPKLDNNVIGLYKAMGRVLSTYTSGKLPKGFKHIPAMHCWEEILYLTEPDKWSPNAVYQATRIFASNMNRKKAEKFYKWVLLPRVREDIRSHHRLHFALYQTLKKAMYKPAAFNKGILFPLFKSGTCNLREAVIIGSVIQKMSLPQAHSSVALLRLAEMDYCGTTRYKHELRKEDKDNLNILVQKQNHRLVTLEIIRELHHSRNRGEKEDNSMLMSSPASVINKMIEDRFDIPEVPMEED